MVEVTATCVLKGDVPCVHRSTGSSRLTFARPSACDVCRATKSQAGWRACCARVKPNISGRCRKRRRRVRASGRPRRATREGVRAVSRAPDGAGMQHAEMMTARSLPAPATLHLPAHFPCSRQLPERRAAIQNSLGRGWRTTAVGTDDRATGGRPGARRWTRDQRQWTTSARA